MFRNLLSAVKARFIYWGVLLKDALATSDKIKGIGGKVLAAVTVLFPASVTAAIGFNSWFTARERVLYPVLAFLLWLLLLMLSTAFDKHQEQQKQMKELEDAKSVKLAIERVFYQHDISKGYLCRVTVRNTSKTTVADNVHVRMSGEVVPGAFVEGYSPFNEPDLLPASGSRSINPDTPSDWIFPESFNQLASHLTQYIDVVRINYGAKTEERTQIFSIEASAASSPPAVAQFEIARDERGVLAFKRHLAASSKTQPPATI